MLNRDTFVPDNTILLFNAEFTDEELKAKDAGFNSSIISDEKLKWLTARPNKKRDWFNPHFYRCLPLSIGNQYGFVIRNEYSFAVEWDGSESDKAIKIFLPVQEAETVGLFPRIDSLFGSGILTVSVPYVLRTPPGVNLITLNPPNVVLPNITVMTGVIETDNLRQTFTFNLKLQMPNIRTTFAAGTMLAAFLPIPRYYNDSFEIKFAKDVLSKEEYLEELWAINDTHKSRVDFKQVNPPGSVDRRYLLGKDVYGNEFLDHQNKVKYKKYE